jgi:hypothetical protein
MLNTKFGPWPVQLQPDGTHRFWGLINQEQGYYRVEGELEGGFCHNLTLTPSRPMPVSLATLSEVAAIVEESPNVPCVGDFDDLVADTRREQIELTNLRDTTLQEAMLYQEMLNFNDHAIHDMRMMQQ